MSFTADTRAALTELAKPALDGVPARIVVGQRRILYEDGGLPVWEFGVTVIGEVQQDQDEIFDDLLSGPGSLKRALESDRSLGGSAIDLRVSRVTGPVSAGGLTHAEWLVEILKEDD